MFLIRFFVVSIMALLMLVQLTVAQDQSLTPEEIRAMVPIAFIDGDDYANVSPDGRFVVIKASKSPSVFDATVIDRLSGETLLTLPNTSQVVFVDNTTLLWLSSIDTQSARLYRLPEASELGRFSLGIKPSLLSSGSGYLYIQGSSVFYQPADLNQAAVRLASGLNYSESYQGAQVEFPDGKRLLIAGQNGAIIYDLETQSQVGNLKYPLMRTAELSADGRRLSVVTNYDPYSSGSSTWRVFDLEQDTQLIELYARMGAHGTISPSGRYAAGAQIATYSRRGNLRVYDLDSKTEIFRVDGVDVGPIGWGGFKFIGENLVYAQPTRGQYTKVLIYVPASNQVIETNIEIWGNFFIPINERLVLCYFEIEPALRMGLFDAQTGELVRRFPLNVSVWENLKQLVVGNVVYGLASDEQPALPSVTGRTTVSGVNVRANPFPNSRRINGVSGAVTAIARNANSTWVYIAEAGGWVSADLIAFDGDITVLTVR